MLTLILNGIFSKSQIFLVLIVLAALSWYIYPYFNKDRNITMELIKNWRDSLTIFIPGNFKLFGLVTLNAYVQSMKVMVRYFWWLILLIAGLAWFGYSSVLVSASLYYGLVMLMAIRPSLHKKDGAYFAEYSLHGIKFFLGYSCIAIFVLLPFVLIANYLEFTSIALGEAVLKPLYWLWAFFFFDSEKTLSSFFKSIDRVYIMTWRNIPFFVITLAAYAVYGWLASPLIALPKAGWVSLVFIDPLWCAFINNFYVKKIHDQFDLYY